MKIVLTMVVKQYYKKQDILRTVNGVQPMEDVFKSIVEILGA